MMMNRIKNRTALLALLLFLGALFPAAAEEASTAGDDPPPMELESYYIVFLKRGPNAAEISGEELAELQSRHLAHLKELYDSGKSLTAGPFQVPSDYELRGLVFFPGHLDPATVERLAHDDPAVAAGRLSVEVLKWWTPKGVVTWNAPAAESADPHLSAEERAALLELLETSKAEFDTLVAGVEGEAWSARPAPDKWSVGEVAEHLLLAEGVIFDRARQALEAEPTADWPAVAAKVGRADILGFTTDRGQQFQAPDGLQPKGEMSREEILARFAEARAATLAFVRDTRDPLKAHTSPNPVFDELNVPQWITFLAGHNLRHNQQIAEVKETLAAAAK